MSIKTPTETYVTTARLIEPIQDHLSSKDRELVERACTFAKDRYGNIAHPAGKPYIEYVSEIALMLMDLKADPVVISAAMISPPPFLERPVVDELKKIFKGEDELLELVEEVLQISRLEWGVWPPEQIPYETKERREILQKMLLLATDEMNCQTPEQNPLTAIHFQKKEKQVENLIRMFLAAATDIRALVIKLVDRLFFIKNMKDLPPQQQQLMNYKVLAKITLSIYAPMADRLGMWPLKSRLEDMSFRLIEPHKYKTIGGFLATKKKEREDYIAQLIPTIKNQLEAYGIEARIVGRAKHIYSIYKKMEAKQLTFDEINDLLGVRIIVDTNENCYNAQSILHEYWQPLTEVYDGKAGRDWIANPKENLYQSLHTTISIEDKTVEVQIRTSAMHKIAEYGVTALQDAVHWRYKESKAYKKAKTPREAREKHRSKQLTNLLKILNGEQEVAAVALKGEQEAVISIVKGLLEDRIFVITPEGHVIDLPASATSLDFAYRIHTDLGHRYTGAKVNGHIVRLDYELKNGEIVELITSRARKGPSPEWLSRSKDEDGNRYYIFARTPQARSKIRHWFYVHNEMQRPKV